MHQARYIFKNVMVDTLQQVIGLNAAGVFHQVGIIDMTGAKGCYLTGAAINGKFGNDIIQIDIIHGGFFCRMIPGGYC